MHGGRQGFRPKRRPERRLLRIQRLGHGVIIREFHLSKREEANVAAD
jgi:hypothetical protein